MIRSDKKKAKSLITAAHRDNTFTQTLPITEHSAATIIRNLYECFRMLGEARLALAGIKSSDHSTQIRELLRMKVHTTRPLQAIETLKTLRHRINYDGYAPTTAQAENAKDLSKACFDACYRAVQEEINT